MTSKPLLVMVGGPDVDKRLDLMDRFKASYDVLAIGSEPGLEPRFKERGYVYHTYDLHRGFHLAADVKSCFQLWRLFRKLKPNLVQTFDTKPNIVARIAAYHAGIPHIYGTQPGLGALYTYQTASIRRKRRIFEFLHRRACHRVSATVFQNQDDLRQFVDQGIVPSEKAVLIPGSGVSESRFFEPSKREQIREQLGILSHQRMVLTAARLIRSKGIMDFVKAAKQMVADKRYRFVVAGGQDPQTLDALSVAELEAMQKHTIWIGERSDMVDLMRAADAFAFLSYYREGIPRVLIEAAFCKLPMIATDAPGSREVVNQQTGLVIPVQEPTKLTHALKELFENAEATARRVAHAYEHARDEFELEHIAQSYLRLYSSQ